MEKETFSIDRDSLTKLGIDPQEAIEYLENKKAKDINPAHVKSLMILRQLPIASS